MQSKETPIFRVDETSDLPIWAQLRNRMTYLIKTGRLSAGEQLPSVRSLAADAKINYNTVTKAYRDLELSGLIVSVRGRGMFVQKDAGGQDDETSAVDAFLESCVKQYRSKGLTYAEIKDRATTMIDDMASKAINAEKEKEGYRYGD